ncbi:MAG: phosphoglucosamine mutase [Thermoproteota archaeon]|nr:phosphoglucosamine mutase [Thermoproteota archaeon]
MRQFMGSHSRLFGTNGVRGIFGNQLSLDVVIDLVHSLGTYYKDGDIIVGCDGRKSSPILTRLVQATLNSDGHDVVDAGVMPTPCLQYSTKKGGFRGGIMITASHNPSEYNGIKPTADDGVEISRKDELKVERIYREKNFTKASEYGVTRQGELLNSYICDVLNLVDAEKIKKCQFKIVMDFGNGVQALVAPILAKQLGCQVISINGNIDGDFPARGSEPTPKNLCGLTFMVKKLGANLGVAYDGDGDRSIFCDDKGVVQWGDRTGTLLVKHLLSTRHKKADVICPINTTSVLTKIVGELGSDVIYTKVGSVEVSREMVKRKAIIGLEENGGFMYGLLNEVRDGALTTALILDMLASDESSLSGMFSTLPMVYQHKAKFRCSNHKVVEVIQNCMNHGNPVRIETLDGVKIWIDDETWVMIRPSGTEPLLRMYAESTDKDLIDSKVKEYTGLINETLLKS